jgi:hypothetical protein
MFDQFSYHQYDKLLNVVETGHKNLTFSDFRNPDIPPNFFILRHDIDFSLSAALKMAQIEAERGIRATYFLLLSSEYYNLLSKESRKVPQKLITLGHEVGLHYDVRAMSAQENTDLNKWLYYEIDMLSNLTGNAIHSIAMHNPSIYGHDPFTSGNHFLNAYDPQFTKAISYFSDSCGAWRDSAYDAFQCSIIPDKLQLLTHPIFWADTPGDRWERLNGWVEERGQALEKYQKKVRKIWGSHSGVKEHDRRLTRRCT